MLVDTEMTRNTKRRSPTHPARQIAWIVDPGGEIEEAIRFVLIRFADDDDEWEVYRVDPRRHSFRYYCYLFALSVLAHHQLGCSSAGDGHRTGLTDASFPLYASDPTYGRIVAYYYHLKDKEKRRKRHADKYKAIPLKLRNGVRTIFVPKSTGGGKNAWIKLGEQVASEHIHFWKFQEHLLATHMQQSTTELHGPNCDSLRIRVEPEVTDDLLRLLLSSDLWTRWEEGPKAWHTAERAETLNEMADVRGIAQEILEVAQENRRVGRKLWQLGKQSLAAKLSRTKDIQEVIECVDIIRNVDEDFPEELYGILDVPELAASLSQAEDLPAVGKLLCMILIGDPDIGIGLWELCKDDLAARLSETKKALLVDACVRHVYFARADLAEELCRLMDKEKLAHNLNEELIFWSVIGECLATFFRASPAAGRELLTHLDLERERVLGRMFGDIWMAIFDLREIHTIDPESSKKLCSHLDMEILAGRLNRSGDSFLGKIGEWISTLLRANGPKGEELLGHLNEDHLAYELSTTEHIDEARTCVEEIYSAVPGFAEDLCRQLQKEPLASVLRQTEDQRARREYLDIIAKANHSVYEDLLALMS